MLFYPRRHLGPAALAAALLAGCGGSGRSRDYVTPLNSKQAPLVTVRQLLQADSLIGRRVRVVGTCALAGSGPSTGAWVLQDGGYSIEVRGLVPASSLANLAGRVAAIDLAPRSAYLLSGPSRTEWEHSIPGVDALRYSLTYRNLRE
jgi:hypothetical protein